MPQIAGQIVVTATGTTRTSCTSNRAALAAECDVLGWFTRVVARGNSGLFGKQASVSFDVIIS